ncbi:MAG: protease inhibitor I42 family protein [Dehalococcoidales bacterium]|nr:protease inhibitor I42 family protein [Dehalococcoidales bacterium]
MKKYFVLIAMLMVTSCLQVGCAEVNAYTDSGQMISISVNQEFFIALGSNRTTCYMWQENYDNDMIGLESIEYLLSDEAKQKLAGAGGVEFFRFKALKKGETEITMVYKRSWEEPSAQDLTKVFTITIE